MCWLTLDKIFPVQGASTLGVVCLGAPTLYFAKFLEKPHEMEKNLVPVQNPPPRRML